ncbi:MAG: serine/threonine protein kinase [Myxococcales bacterium]|nr:serine/threonine protein kinase [Myxococcales bacterium]
MECLDANVVQDLMAGALDAPSRVLAIEHLDGCQDCRELIAMLARGATHEVALDTLGDTEKRPPSVAMLETVASDAGLGSTRSPDLIETADGMGETLAPEESVTKAVRIRAPSQLGRKLGRYTLVERLGAGAMGVVYRAEDSELGRDVALKQLHRPDEALTTRLIREARSMAQVNHPNVVAVYDVGVIDDATYIAMELVTGASLRTWQQTRSIREIVEAYLAAGRGLSAAHAAGLVHRDFKPDNVLVGQDGRVRVTDFGLAASRPDQDLIATADRSAARSIADVNLTTSGSVLGTPAYMAPEQFLGGNVDARTDQFNFCVALYEALYSQRPFSGKNFDELSDSVCEGKIQPPPAASRVSGAIRAIILRGLSVKPGDRFPTMDHLLAELGRDRAKPWRRTSIAAAALAGVLALGLGADLAVRSRVVGSIRQSFTATAKQADRAVRLLTDQFDAISNLVYLFPVMGDVSAHHDQADFGLGDPADDNKDLDEIHERLVSADWRLARDFGGREHQSILAVADYKARLLYTSADPSAPRTDLSVLPWVKQALDAGSGNSTILVRYDDPQLVATRLLGPRPPSGVAMVFARTRSLGEAAKTQFFQIVEARGLLDQIRLDDTLLSIVAPDGTPVGDVPEPLVAAGPRIGQAEITLDGVVYELEARPLVGPGTTEIGRLVMAQRMDGVLSLFPNARLVFVLGMLAMLGLAVGTAVRARRIMGTVST